MSAMASGTMGRVFNPDQLNEWFNATADARNTKDLLFSTIFDLIKQVVSGSYKSIHAAYQTFNSIGSHQINPLPKIDKS